MEFRYGDLVVLRPLKEQELIKDPPEYKKCDFYSADSIIGGMRSWMETRPNSRSKRNILRPFKITESSVAVNQSRVLYESTEAANLQDQPDLLHTIIPKDHLISTTHFPWIPQSRIVPYITLKSRKRPSDVVFASIHKILKRV